MSDDYSQIRLTPMEAIRKKCMDCTCQQQTEVRTCHIIKCPIWRYGMGKEQRDELYPNTNRGNHLRKGNRELYSNDMPDQKPSIQIGQE